MSATASAPSAALRLHPDTLHHLAAGVAKPRYDRRELRAGIVHLGLGAFARAHLAPLTDAAIDACGDLRWGIVGVSLRHADTRDALAPQAGLYTLALRDAQGESLQVIGCVVEQLVAPEDPAAVLERIAHAHTRIVSLTVTEKGYCHDPATRALRFDHADIEHDLAQPGAPRSAIGFIVRGLALRRARNLEPVTLLSCDNLPANGDTLRALVLAFAQRVDAALADWIAAHCTFPNSMVDRIVPRTTDADRAAIAGAIGVDDAWPVLGERFLDWAIEDRFAAGRPDWSAGGARFVAEAAPFERLKLRMVNGSHSALAYLGSLAGFATVDRAIAEPALRGYVDALLRDEIAPTLTGLPPDTDLDAYRARLLQRYANPALAHRLSQIAMDGSQKLPQRLLGPVSERLRDGAGVDRLALAVAAWLVYLRTHTPIDDPLASELAAWPADAMLDFAPVFGDLGRDQRFVAAVNRMRQALQRAGVLATAASLR